MPEVEQGPYQPRDAGSPIAPAWHTAALILLILSVALVGTLIARSAPPASPIPPDGRLGIYLPMLVVPWMLTFYVAYVGRAGRAQRGLGGLLGRGWRRGADVAIDLATGFALAVLIRVLEPLLAPAIDSTHAAAVASMLPRSGLERAAWILVAASTAFGEEIVYRGYFQRQLGALVRSRALGVALQALLFGVAHLAQGPAAAARVTLYGVLFGVLTVARGSLLPAIVAHLLVDASAALG